MKKLYLFGILIFVVFIISCTGKEYPALYQSFNSTETGSTISPENVNPGSPMNLEVKFDKRKVYINDQAFNYKVIEDSEDYLMVEVEHDPENSVPGSEFRYDKVNDILTMMKNGDQSEIKLMTTEKMLAEKLNSFAKVKLSSNLEHLDADQVKMLGLLFDAAKIMDDIFWQEAYGDKSALFESTENDTLQRLFEINYGPWERLNNDQPFLSRYEEKPRGANFYPRDMSLEEFDTLDDPDKTSQYTLIRRNDQGKLYAIWYHDAFSDKLKDAATLLKEASKLSKDQGFARYLRKRAEALLSDNYYESDVAWMQMKDNDIDFVIGPIENYEDKLFNYKSAHESFILIKDQEWSKKLGRLTALLPGLQKELPVDEKFKKEKPSANSDINVYDALYYAGDCNAGSKTIAINLPNDPKVRSKYGSRKLQLKNSIRYKFEQILVPISNVLIAEDQRQFIDFDAFFENTMFHEVAHGLGLDYTINGKGEVRTSLKETYSAIEEGKADILGLFIVTHLAEMGELGEKELMTNYVTFMAGIFRSVRFGASSAHGTANMIRFAWFKDEGAFSRDPETGTYWINFDKMKEAMQSLTEEIIRIQGLGSYEEAASLIREKGTIGEELQSDLHRLDRMNIPVDIIFEQGKEAAGI